MGGNLMGEGNWLGEIGIGRNFPGLIVLGGGAITMGDNCPGNY